MGFEVWKNSRESFSVKCGNESVAPDVGEERELCGQAAPREC